MIERRLQGPTLNDLPVDILSKRIGWDNEMLDFLQERRQLIVQELAIIDGQVMEVKADKANLFEIMARKTFEK